jgi:hypothetical protein
LGESRQGGKKKKQEEQKGRHRAEENLKRMATVMQKFKDIEDEV